MPDTTDTRVPSPHWTLFAHQGHLLVTGGADETYVVDEAGTVDAQDRLLAAWRTGAVTMADLPASARAAARQLQRLGALVPARATLPAPTWAIAWLDTPDPDLQQALQQPGPLAWVEEAADADAVLVIRRHADWQTALAAYAANPPRAPHLFLDLAYHHTLCLGPYVVPGETACVACLGARIAHRWGDAPVPALPRTAADTALAAALIRQRLTQTLHTSDGPAHAGWLPLLERSISLNLHTLVSQQARVFRLPWCAVCASDAGQVRAEPLPLPWLAGGTAL